jgi:hypothetical protein
MTILPSLRDILEWKWRRNPEVIDLTAEDDVVGTLNNPKFPELTLVGPRPLIAPVSSLRDNHRSNVSGASPIFCHHSATTSVAYAAIKLFYNAQGRYGFFGSPNTEKDAVQKDTVVVSVSR